MQIQKSVECNLLRQKQECNYCIQDFMSYINKVNNNSEVNLISEYIMLLCEYCLQMLSEQRIFKYNMMKQQVDEQTILIQIRIQFSLSEISTRILVIQMDRVIKIVIKNLINNDNKIYETSDNKIYETRDQLWFDYVRYIDVKICNRYKLISIKQLNVHQYNKHNNKSNKQSQLNYLLVSRILFSIANNITRHNIHHNSHHDNILSNFNNNKISSNINTSNNNQKMITQFDNLRFFNPNPNQSIKLGYKLYSAFAVSQNLFKITSYLNIKSIIQLKQISIFMIKHFFQSQTLLFKSIYQYNYGPTGFQIHQINWPQLLNKKRTQNIKSKIKSKSNPNQQNTQLFRNH